MIKNLLICCLLLIGLAACEKEVDMAQLPGSDLQGYQIRDIITSDNTGSNWFKDTDIWMFSKRKPVDHDSIPNRSTEWWYGKYDDCGIVIDTVSSNPVESAKKTWRYRQVTTMKCAGDFAGYTNDGTEYNGMGAPISFSAPATEDNRHPFIMYFKMLAVGNNVLGVKEIFGKRLANFWDTCSFGVIIRAVGGTDYLFVTTNKLSSLSNSNAISEHELRIDKPIDFPTIFKDKGNEVEIYPFICNTIQATPVLNAPYTNNYYSIRALNSYPEFYKSTITPYVPPTLFTVTGRYVKESWGWNSMKVSYYIALSITNSQQQGGTLSYQLTWTDGKNIYDPSLPITQNGSMGIPVGSPVGTKVEKLIDSQIFYTNEGASEARVVMLVKDMVSGEYVAQSNIEWSL